jgi:hypothetical protein
MGLFYTSFTLWGPDGADIAAALKKMGRTAFVSPTVDRFTSVYDRQTEEQDFGEIGSFGSILSKQICVPVLGAALHDDDVLYLWLFQNGECRDFYNSLPQYFDQEAEPGPPEGGDADALCKAFGSPSQSQRVESLLRANLLSGERPDIAGELERHQAILKELKMPAFSAAITYSSIEGGYLSEEFQDVVFSPV